MSNHGFIFNFVSFPFVHSSYSFSPTFKYLILIFDWKQEGATKEEIDQLPKYKFRIIKEGDIEESSRGIMIESETGTATEHVVALEDAVSSYCFLE